MHNARIVLGVCAVVCSFARTEMNGPVGIERQFGVVADMPPIAVECLIRVLEEGYVVREDRELFREILTAVALVNGVLWSGARTGEPVPGHAAVAPLLFPSDQQPPGAVRFHSVVRGHEQSSVRVGDERGHSESLSCGPIC